MYGEGALTGEVLNVWGEVGREGVLRGEVLNVWGGEGGGVENIVPSTA